MSGRNKIELNQFFSAEIFTISIFCIVTLRGNSRSVIVSPVCCGNFGIPSCLYRLFVVTITGEILTLAK